MVLIKRENNMLTVQDILFYQQVEINKVLMKKLAIEQARVEQFSEAYEILQQQVSQLRRKIFGSQSERYIDDQLQLFGDLSEPKVPEEDDGVTIPSHKRKKPKKNEPPVRIEIITVPEGQRTCACGKEKKLIGYEVKRMHHYISAVLEILEQRREKLGCDCDQSTLTVAPAPLLTAV